MIMEINLQTGFHYGLRRKDNVSLDIFLTVKVQDIIGTLSRFKISI